MQALSALFLTAREKCGLVAIHRPMPGLARQISETETSGIGSKPAETRIVATHSHAIVVEVDREVFS
jgi:hypothetical protein